ncbi:MAG: hypothetical protein P8Y34_07865 [Anaerolineales bacterium]
MTLWNLGPRHRSRLAVFGLLISLIIVGCRGKNQEPYQQPTATPACSIVDYSLAIKPLLEEFQESFYKVTRANLNTEQIVYERDVSLRLKEDLSQAACSAAFPELTRHLNAVFQSYEQALDSILNQNLDQAKNFLESTQQSLADFEEAYRIRVEATGD